MAFDIPNPIVQEVQRTKPYCAPSAVRKDWRWSAAGKIELRCMNVRYIQVHKWVYEVIAWSEIYFFMAGSTPRTNSIQNKKPNFPNTFLGDPEEHQSTTRTPFKDSLTTRRWLNNFAAHNKHRRTHSTQHSSTIYKYKYACIHTHRRIPHYQSRPSQGCCCFWNFK